MKKRIVTSLLALVLLAGALAGCAGGKNENSSSGTPAASGSTTPAASGSSTPAEATAGKSKYSIAICGINLDDGMNAMLQMPAEGYNTMVKNILGPKFPGTEIEMIAIPWDGADAKARTLLQSNGADIINQGGAFLPQYYKEGLIANLSELMANDTSWKYEDNFPASLKSHPHTLSYDGSTTISLPWAVGNRVIAFDKKLFDDWGVEYLSEKPTPEEILEKAAKMTGTNPVTGEQNYGVWNAANSLNMSFIASASMTYGDMGVTGDFSDPKNLQWSLNSEGFVKAVQWACDLSKFSPPSSATGQGFEKFGRENNDVAIQIDRPSGAVMSTYYQSGDESMIARYGVSMNIGPDGSNWTPVDGVALNAALKGDDLTKAWEIMKELAGKDITTWRFKNWGPSAQPHLVSAELYDPKDLGLAVNNKIIEVSGVHPGYEMNPFYGSGIQPVLASMISRTMAGETVDVQKELDDLQAKAVAWSATK